MGRNGKEGARVFSAVSADRAQLKHMKIHLNTGKHFFIVWVIKHWHRLPREVMESPSLTIHKMQCNLLQLNLPEQRDWTGRF